MTSVIYISPEKPEDLLRHKNLIDEINRSSDRAAAIIAGALLEDGLTECLKSVVKHKGSLWADKTKPDGPLGAFGTKADILFMFGFISNEAHDDLKNLIKIRNDFAHNPDFTGFDDQSISARCMNLKKVVEHVMEPPPDDPYGTKLGSGPEGSYVVLVPRVSEVLKTARGRFLWSVYLFTIRLGSFAKMPERRGMAV